MGFSIAVWNVPPIVRLLNNLSPLLPNFIPHASLPGTSPPSPPILNPVLSPQELTSSNLTSPLFLLLLLSSRTKANLTYLPTNSIREFCPVTTPIIMLDKDGNHAVLTVEELLPMSFGPEMLGVGRAGKKTG